jgi:hypothetical protein
VTRALAAAAVAAWSALLVWSLIDGNGLDCPPMTSAPADAYGYGWEPC